MKILKVSSQNIKEYCIHKIVFGLNTSSGVSRDGLNCWPASSQAFLRFLTRDRKALREDFTENAFLGFPMIPCASPKSRVEKEAPGYEADC